MGTKDTGMSYWSLTGISDLEGLGVFGSVFGNLTEDLTGIVSRTFENRKIKRRSSCLTLRHVGWIKAISQSFGGPPFGADHHVVSRLVPEVVSKGRRFAWVLPVTHHLKRLTVQEDETT